MSRRTPLAGEIVYHKNKAYKVAEQLGSGYVSVHPIRFGKALERNTQYIGLDYLLPEEYKEKDKQLWNKLCGR